ncbi:MAG TPA: hypothetical protein VJO52_09880, partial [Gemmatimonadaceae bacterium]|nr:hypothetical protein [Gemmatimonadaceae bacterium]
SARRDTLRYTILNPFRLYWLRGDDTVGPEQRELSVESHVWDGPPERPRVTIRNQLLDVSRRLQHHVFALEPNGRLRTVDGGAPRASQSSDLLLGLPPAPLRAGTSWTDTVRMDGTDPAGAELYQVIRTYNVRQVLDTLGARHVAQVEAQGTIHYRFGFLVDSEAHKIAWLDVAGPDTEQYLFDTDAGRLLGRRWTMHLVGRGVPPDAPDTVPAGLESLEVVSLANTPLTRFLLEPLPGADTSLTFTVSNRSIILLHTTARGRTRISASLARNDGLVGVASVDVNASSITGYRATWTDSTSLRTQAVTVRAGSLLVVRRGQPETSVAIPAGASWGIADYAMNELLTPVLLALPRDGAPHPIAIFRPYTAHWDTGTARVRTRGDFIAVALEIAGEQSPETMVFTKDGDFLFGDNADAIDTRRVPSDARRIGHLQAALAAVGR